MIKRLNHSGFSLVEVLVATGLMTIVGATIMGLYQFSNKDSQQLRALRVVASARSKIEAAFKNPVAWRQTVANNTSFACTSSGAGCNLASSNNGFHDFVLYSATPGEALTYTSSDPKTRYALRGGACPAGTPNPDERCPLKYVARWKPLCQTYPCANPTLEVRISLVAEFGANAPPINVQKYEFATVRGIDDGSLQSACQILNGTYNVATGTCYPKNAGKTCAALGKPAQIVSSVDMDGNLTCAPLYSGVCNPSTQVMSGITSSGQAKCTTRSQPPNCPTPCVGAWGSCSQSCGGGTRTYSVITPATNGGAACTAPAPGATQSCNTGACPVNCSGSWSACSQPCGGGTSTFTIWTPASGGGSSCAFNNGDSIACNTQACAVPVNCAGTWSSCNPSSGTKTFTMTQAPQNGGAACPSPTTQNCPVDCVGSWGACSSGASPYKTYTWTTTAKNGGSTATCAYANGQTDSAGCAPPPPAMGHYSCYNMGGGAPEVSCSNRQYLCNADDANVANIESQSCTIGDTTSFNRGCDDCGSNGISGGFVSCECVP